MFDCSTEILKHNKNQPFEAVLIGEGAHDGGGPFRDLIDNICIEITNRFL